MLVNSTDSFKVYGEFLWICYFSAYHALSVDESHVDELQENLIFYRSENLIFDEIEKIVVHPKSLEHSNEVCPLRAMQLFSSGTKSLLLFSSNRYA